MPFIQDQGIVFYKFSGQKCWPIGGRHLQKRDFQNKWTSNIQEETIIIFYFLKTHVIFYPGVCHVTLLLDKAIEDWYYRKWKQQTEKCNVLRIFILIRSYL